jgi:hypothetical protein
MKPLIALLIVGGIATSASRGEVERLPKQAWVTGLNSWIGDLT